MYVHNYNILFKNTVFMFLLLTRSLNLHLLYTNG